MKVAILHILLVFGTALVPLLASAQPGQCIGGGCSTGVQFGATLSTNSNVFVNAVAGTWGGEYNTYNVTAGQQYEWSLCTADGATNPSADMELTLTDNATNAIICFSNNVCGTQPKILWTSNLTGVVRVYVHSAGCVTNTVSHTVRWRCVSCAAPVAPSNDLVCNATPIACGQTLAGTTINATLSGTGEGLACGGTPTQPSVWYTVTGNGQIMTASLCGTAWDSRIQIFSGANCSTLTCVGGNDDGGPACTGSSASFQWTSVVGLNYYIFVAGYSSTNAFNLALTCTAPPTPPANDLICNATPIACGQTVNGTTVNATPTGTGEAQNCGGFTQAQPGVWYSVVGNGNNINASLCATAWDSRIQVFTGASCSAVTCVGGNNDSGPLCAGNAASYSWATVTGQNYYILVSGSAANAAFTLSLACQTPCTAACNGGPPPANDACSGAQNLGAVPAPPQCVGLTGGVGTPITFNTTNICATAEPNYSSLLGCTPSGNQASPAADVWYRFTIVAPILNITINGLGTPNVALYEGINCANLLPRGCSIGSGGLLGTQFQGLAAGTYYLQVSGGDILDQCNFSLTLQNNYDCQGCVLAANLDVTPPPVNGQYQPGTLVTFCYQITSYSQYNSNWLHGVIPTFGPGWDISTFTALPTTTVTQGVYAPSCGGNGTWSWYNSPISSSASGVAYGPGFFFETISGSTSGVVDGNPGNNWGDNNPNAIYPNTNLNDDCRWTFCWQIRTKQLSACVQDQSLNVTINTTGDSESGSWTNNACIADPTPNFFAQSNCCPTPTVTVTNPTCTAGSTGSAIGQGLGTSPWTYVWKNAAGVTLLTNTNTAGTSTITGLTAGDYTLAVTDAAGCTSYVAFSIVAPANYTVVGPSSNPTICINTAITPITFTTTGATAIGAATGLPAGLNATWFNNVITISGTPTASGTFNYSIPLTGGCGNVNAIGTITVTPVMTATSTAPNRVVCANAAMTPAITFTTTGATGIGVPTGLPAGVSAAWVGNQITISGTPTTAGTYNYSIPLAGGCGTASAAGTITVNPIPTATFAASSVYRCSGWTGTIPITVSPSGALVTYSINGGPPVTPPNSGTLINIASVSAPSTLTILSVSAAGCTATTPAVGSIWTETINVVTASITGNTSVCSGGTSTLTFTGPPGGVVIYAINGTSQATPVTLSATGTATLTTAAITANTTYSIVSVNVTGAGTCSISNASLIVNVVPSVVPSFPAFGPYCYGATAPALPTTSTNSVAGTWSPATINTTLVGVTNYTFTPSGSCGTPYEAAVTVYERPLVYAHGTNPTCSIPPCNGTATVDVTGGVGPYTYLWSNGGVTQSLTALCEGPYTVTVTDANNCASQAFTPVSGCFQIQSIGVDACGLGTQEGLNEMFFIQIGSAPLNLLGATVTWPSNSFTSFNCTNAAFIAAANATITSGGVILPVPVGGILPANANVVIMTSSAPTINPNTFANISDTLFMAFHCATNSNGYFLNGSGSGTRTLSMSFGTSCTDQVTYDVGPLVDSDGAYANFSQSGVATYLDYDCVAPFAVQDNSIVLDAPDPILPTFNAVGPYCSGDVIPSLPTSSTNPTPITGTWTPAINNTSTTTYTFTPSAGQCANTTTLQIVVNPLPTTTVNSSAICSGGTATVTATPSPSGTYSYAWTVPTGVTNPGNVSTFAATAAGIYSVVVSTTGTPVCSSLSAQGIVTVNPTPVATATPNPQTICSGSGAGVALSSNVSGTTFSWLTTSNTSVTGESTTAQLGSTITDILTNTTTSAATLNYTVTPTAGTCPGAAISVSVTVNPVPIATASPNPQTICSGSGAGVALSSNVSGTTFSWLTTSNTSVTGESTTAQLGSTITDILTNTTTSAATLNYTVTPTAATCAGLPINVPVTVSPQVILDGIYHD